jgi:hypothetical protein
MILQPCLHPIMHIDGLVSVLDETNDDQRRCASIPLQELIADAVSPDMLEDEPDAEHLLRKLLEGLKISQTVVEDAMRNIART